MAVVLPAQAGMIPESENPEFRLASSTRASGDDPDYTKEVSAES